MLRSLYSGVSGLRSHQAMLDVTGNNIANVNTAGFKSSAVQFQDTLSQLAKAAAGPQAEAGGTNPAQVGLGVQVGGISTNFSQGSAQSTGRSTDMMISGDGFFITAKGGERLYSRAGAFDLDVSGRLVSPDGAVLQGWTANNGILADGGPVDDIVLSSAGVTPAKATSTATVAGNLPAEAAAGDTLVRDVKAYDTTGTELALTLTFTRNATGWAVDGTDGTSSATGQLDFTDGVLDPAPAPMVVGGIAVDLSTVTGFAGLTTAVISGQNGNKAGTLESFSIAADGSVTGSFSNGLKQTVARVAMANFANPGGLEKAGASGYRTTVNSGEAEIGVGGSAGFGGITGGYLEMSNVDLSQEFTNLIVAQRGFQANARIITTSDEVLQELTNLKR